MGQAKMAILKSYWNQLTGASFNDGLQLFCFLVQECVIFEFGHVTLQQNVEQFVLCWAIFLCKMEGGQLVLHVWPHKDVGEGVSVSGDMLFFWC